MRLVSATVVLLAGCSSGPVLYNISGTVEYNGIPVPAGQIFFEADVTRKNDGPQGFAQVRDGKFDTAQNGRGVLGGPYLIRIVGFDGKPAPEMPFGQILFRDYEERHDLPKKTQEMHFKVPAKGKS